MPTAPRRRWFQFSLSSLLLLTLVVALAVYGANENRHRMRLEAEVERLESELRQVTTPQIMSLELQLKNARGERDRKVRFLEREIRNLELDKKRIQAEKANP